MKFTHTHTHAHKGIKIQALQLPKTAIPIVSHRTTRILICTPPPFSVTRAPDLAETRAAKSPHGVSKTTSLLRKGSYGNGTNVFRNKQMEQRL